MNTPCWFRQLEAANHRVDRVLATLLALHSDTVARVDEAALMVPAGPSRTISKFNIYSLDSGLLCYPMRIASPDDLTHHALRGAIFETWVVSETLKHRFNRGLTADLYFWRDNHGIEFDLVFEHGQRLHSVEIKSGTTYAAYWLGPARRWRALAGAEAADPVLVYGGSASHAQADHQLLSWQALGMTT